MLGRPAVGPVVGPVVGPAVGPAVGPVVGPAVGHPASERRQRDIEKHDTICYCIQCRRRIKAQSLLHSPCVNRFEKRVHFVLRPNFCFNHA